MNKKKIKDQLDTVNKSINTLHSSVDQMAQSVLELKQTAANKLINGESTTFPPFYNAIERQTAIKLTISYLIKGLLVIYEQEGEVAEEDIHKVSECIASL